jgi:hypothetical protein
MVGAGIAGIGGYVLARNENGKEDFLFKVAKKIPSLPAKPAVCVECNFAPQSKNAWPDAGQTLDGKPW